MTEEILIAPAALDPPPGRARYRLSAKALTQLAELERWEETARASGLIDATPSTMTEAVLRNLAESAVATSAIEGEGLSGAMRESLLLGVPVVASGGCGSVAHMAEVLTRGGASAALAASIFHFGEVRLGDARAELLARGVEVRP